MGFDWTAARTQISGNFGYMGQQVTIGGTAYPANVSEVPEELVMQEQGFRRRIEFRVVVSIADLADPPAVASTVTYQGTDYKVKGDRLRDELNHSFTIYRVG